MKPKIEDIFCEEIIPGKSKVIVVSESSRDIAFEHTAPSHDVHIVVAPKKHIASIVDLLRYPLTAQQLMTTVTRIAKTLEAKHGACRIISNVGDYQDSNHLCFEIVFGEIKR